MGKWGFSNGDRCRVFSLTGCMGVATALNKEQFYEYTLFWLALLHLFFILTYNLGKWRTVTGKL